MTRADHQPQEAVPDRPRRTAEELRAALGRTIAFVLALGEPPEPAIDIRPAAEAARIAQVPAVFVFASPQRASEATEAVRTLPRKGRSTLVQAVEVDPAMMRLSTQSAGNFELFGLPFGLLEAMRAVAGSVLDDYDSVLVLDGAQDGITPEHLFELAGDLRRDPDLDVVASWIQWLRRCPYLVSRAFLEGLEERGLTKADEGTGKAPVIRTFDHVFGEERLAAPSAAPAKVVHFLDRCTMTALQAVDLAKYAKTHPEEELHTPNQKLSLMGPVTPEPLGSSDALLVQVAGQVSERGRKDAQEAGDAIELSWADAFGQRNRRDFPLLNDRAHAGRLAYLDSAATAQRVDVALAAQREFDEHQNANVYRGAYDLSANATFALNDARKRIEDFIGAARRQTVLCANTTAAINLVAGAWGEHHIGEGDLVVVALSDHHSNMLPFAMLAERKGARVEYVPYDEAGRIDRREFEIACRQRPKLVCLAQIGNVFGIEAPVAELAAEARAAGARVLVDAAQSFPHVKIDVTELGADWMAFSGHKAYGPMGIGCLWISDEAFAEMDPLGGGGGTVSHVSTSSYYLRPKSLQYEMGTPPVSQAIGFAAAVDYLDALGMDSVCRHSAALTRYLVRGLQRIDGVTVIGDHSQPDGQCGLVSFTLRSVAPAQLAAFLGGLDVAIRAGGHCALPLHASLGLIGTGRISIAVHTTRDDLDAALAAIELCRRAYES